MKKQTKKRFLLLVLLLCLALLAACGAKEPEVEPEPEPTPTQTLSDIARVEAPQESGDTVFTVTVLREVPTVDLSELEDRGPIKSLTVICDFPLEQLILPNNAERVELDLNALQSLDASGAAAMKQLQVHGEVRTATPCHDLESLLTDGASLAAMSGFSSVTQLTVIGWADLKELANFSQLEDLSLMNDLGDEPWDLRPIQQLSLKALRFHSHVALSPETLEGLAGASIPTVQMSDWGIHDISFLDAMPDTTVLLLQIGQDQPAEVSDVEGEPCPADVAAQINTRIPAEQLASFASTHELYLFERINDDVEYPK